MICPVPGTAAIVVMPAYPHLFPPTLLVTFTQTPAGLVVWE